MTEGGGEIRKSRPAIFKRVLSGLVLGPVVIFCILFDQWTFTGLMAIAAVISMAEWFRMAKAARHRYIYTAGGALYLAATFGSYVALRMTPHGHGLAVTVILAVWASDIGAYFTGKSIGGPKLAPAISPNKTWAGFGGALFFSGLMLLVLIIIDHFTGSYFGTHIAFDAPHLFAVFIVGCLLGAAGQAGDLFISAFKRKGGLKDTGQLIPGHGGLLDRIDSLLLVAPVFLLIVLSWQK